MHSFFLSHAFLVAKTSKFSILKISENFQTTKNKDAIRSRPQSFPTERTDEVIKINGALITAQPPPRQLPTNFHRHTTCKLSPVPSPQRGETKTSALQNHLLGPSPAEQPTAAPAINKQMNLHTTHHYNEKGYKTKGRV